MWWVAPYLTVEGGSQPGQLTQHRTLTSLLPHLLPLPAPPLFPSPAGSDGCEYMFLLKGHEDLRQDERVMQLFELITTLLAANQDTLKRHLQ